MAFPSTFSSFNRPTPSDRLNSPSHSALHNTVSSAVGQLEAVIGLDSSTLGTIIGDLRNPLSGGGGHVQAANKGGTGQTSFNKGDTLVATSASVLSKLAAGNDGDFLRANSSVAAGLQWIVSQTNKIATSATPVSIVDSAVETSLMSVTIPGSILGAGNAIRAKLFISNINVSNNAAAIVFKGNYGTSSVVTMVVGSLTAVQSFLGVIEMNLIARNSISSQTGIANTDLYKTTIPYAQVSSFVGQKQTVINRNVNVGSDAPMTIGFTARWADAHLESRIDTEGYIIEKII